MALISLSLLAPTPAHAQSFAASVKSQCLSPVEMKDKVHECTAAVSGANVPVSMLPCFKSNAEIVIGKIGFRGDKCVSLDDIGAEIGRRFGGCRVNIVDTPKRINFKNRAALKDDAVTLSRSLVALSRSAIAANEKSALITGSSVRQQCSGRCGYCCSLVATFGYTSGQSCFSRCYYGF
jgi:hypothetical protein